jgi:hypothetical protein
MMFWCPGMFSSASTWSFNVVHQIALSLAPVRPPIPVFLDFGGTLPWRDDECGSLIVKTHGMEIARELGGRAEAILVTTPRSSRHDCFVDAA